MRPASEMLNTSFPPRPGSALPHLGTYVREMPVSVERMYENALDWQHLPYLHAASFSRIELLATGEDFWRARVWNAPPRHADSSVIELRLDRTCRRWITSTYDGANAGGEIWTHCIPMVESAGEQRLIVVVDFYATGVAAADRARVGAAYAALYERLYDEDEGMMKARQAALTTRSTAAGAAQSAAPSPKNINLGPASALPELLPLDVNVGARRFRLAAVSGGVCAYALQCPHALGPLDDAPIIDGEVVCPWHGYRFDVRTGARADEPQEDAPHCSLPVLRVWTDAEGNARLA